jgi:hypothetical protein
LYRALASVPACTLRSAAVSVSTAS